MSDNIKQCIFCGGEVHKFDAIEVNSESTPKLAMAIDMRGSAHKECVDTAREEYIPESS